MPYQVTTLTLCKYNGFSNQYFGFKMVGAGHQFLKKIKGLTFYKLMGSGRDQGFSIWPDFSVYALLQVWDAEEDAVEFFNSSPLIKKYTERATEMATIFMKTKQSHGLWNNKMPFIPSSNLDANNPLLAVITRASIRTKRLFAFWRFVPHSQKPIGHAKGLLITKGIGEVPIKEMATFSLWESEKDMQQFAYRSQAHREAIRLTRSLNWYKEELFARFQPYRFSGQWNGKVLDFSSITSE